MIAVFWSASVRMALACIGLLCASEELAAAAGQHVRQTDTVVLLDFSSTVPEYFWEVLKAELHRSEIAARPLASSQILWIRKDQFRKGMDFPEILQVSVKGDCMPVEQNHDVAPGPLGWVYQVGDEIQPFAFVNCNRIAYFLAREMRGQTRNEQQNKMARAIARIIIHELTHILTQNIQHTNSGLQRSFLTQAELLRDDLP
jgi:hypothetical protein